MMHTYWHNGTVGGKIPTINCSQREKTKQRIMSHLQARIARLSLEQEKKEKNQQQNKFKKHVHLLEHDRR